MNRKNLYVEQRPQELVFKMAVALGFDAPRAFTLVSMRASRDPQFGVQLVGRILRVHRRLQSPARTKALPEALNFGYVFLADAESQEGLELAGQTINAIQTEYAKASTVTVVVRFNEGIARVTEVDESGQIGFLSLDVQDGPNVGHSDAAENKELSQIPGTFDFGTFFGGSSAPYEPDGSIRKPLHVVGSAGIYRYLLRTGVPRRFKTQVVCTKNEVTEEDCAQRFVISTRELFEVMKNKISVEKRTLDVLAHTIQQEFNFAADLSASQAAEAGQRTLLKNKTFDPRELRRALLRKMQMVMREEAMSEADDPEKIAHFLDVILATHPELLFEAQKAAHAKNAEILDAEDLPSEFVWAEPLPTSARNVYGVLPAGMNTWERPFAELLDRDPHKIVKWWHRNEPRLPWSVNALMPDGRGFYPDFVIGIEGRKSEEGALLADPKLNFQRDDEAPKVLAEHRSYGRVMILFLDGERWMTVGYDEKSRRPIISREFRLADAAGF